MIAHAAVLLRARREAYAQVTDEQIIQALRHAYHRPDDTPGFAVVVRRVGEFLRDPNSAINAGSLAGAVAVAWRSEGLFTSEGDCKANFIAAQLAAQQICDAARQPRGPSMICADAADFRADERAVMRDGQGRKPQEIERNEDGPAPGLGVW